MSGGRRVRESVGGVEGEAVELGELERLVIIVDVHPGLRGRVGKLVVLRAPQGLGKRGVGLHSRGAASVYRTAYWGHASCRSRLAAIACLYNIDSGMDSSSCSPH